MKNPVPISLYIHIPWCVRKCPYCDFNSHQATGELPEAEYVEQLIHDLRTDLERYEINRPLNTIFIGGGTPSLFSGASIATLLEQINTLWPISPHTEITLEANPGTVEQQRFIEYRTAGVNRLSLGVQSFSPEKLMRLGRIHDGADAIRAVDAARSAGFTNFNLDLMYGLPDQTIDEGLADLQQALALQPTHLSWYQLTLEPNTVFYKKPPKLPNEDLIAELQDTGQALLAEHGFPQYEISAYAAIEKRCAHNLNYWHYGDYLGIGAGAHGKITQAPGAITRTRKLKQPDSYLKTGNFTAQHEQVPAEQIAFEYMLNALRLNEVIHEADFTARTGLKFSDIAITLDSAVEKKLLKIKGPVISKTILGQQFLNNLLELFI
jgi:putative oxygen-independent coproporphyrinogen III oxidase